MNQSLVTTIHPQFALRALLWDTEAALAHRNIFAGRPTSSPHLRSLNRSTTQRSPTKFHNSSHRNGPSIIHTQTIPVRVKATVRDGHGKPLPPNINVLSTTVQKFSHENSMSHSWPPETMTSGKFGAQKILFDYPSVLLGDQFAPEVLHNNSLPALVRMPPTRNRGPGFHCRCNLRCETKSSNQPSLSPWFKIEYLLCIFEILYTFFASMHANHCPPRVPIQQLNVAYSFSPLEFLRLIRNQETSQKTRKNPTKIVGVMTESKSVKRSQPLFRGSNPPSTYHHNLDGEPPPLSDLFAQLPPDPADRSRLPPHPP